MSTHLMPSNLTDTKYPHVADWICNNLVYGDTKAFFIDLIDRKAIVDACVKASEIVYNEFTKILNGEFDRSVYGDVTDLLILASPFPGNIKRPHTIDHLEDYFLTFDINEVSPVEDFYNTYKLDTPTEKRSTLEFMRLFYDDPTFNLD